MGEVMRYFVCCFLMMLATSAVASKIIVSDLLVNMVAGQHYTNIKVKNTGKSKAYVLVKVSKVLDPGMPGQTIENLQDNPYQLGLIAVPNKLILAPKQVRIIRIMNLNVPPLKRDQVYHLLVTPVVGTLVSSFQNGKKEAENGIEIIEAYKTKVFVRPRNAAPILKFVRKGHALTVTNVGNTNILIGSVTQCLKSGCQNVINKSKRLYAGNAWHISLPYNMPVILKGQFLNQQKTYHTK